MTLRLVIPRRSSIPAALAALLLPLHALAQTAACSSRRASPSPTTTGCWSGRRRPSRPEPSWPRVGDTTSGWYNPAGMATMTRTRHRRERQRLRDRRPLARGRGQAAGRRDEHRTSSRPSSARSWARDVIDSEHWRIGLTITKPTSWNQEIVGRLGGDTRIAYSSHVNLSTLLPMFSASYSPFPSLRFGRRDRRRHHLALRGPVLLRAGGARPPPRTGSCASSTAAGRFWNLTGTLGVQWDVRSISSVGRHDPAPGVEDHPEREASPTRTWRTGDALEPRPSSTTRTPPSTGSLPPRRERRGRLALEGLRGRGRPALPLGHLQVARCSASSQPGLDRTTPTVTGFPVYSTQPFAAGEQRRRTGLELRRRRTLQPDETWSFHGGFFTDGSRPTRPGERLFRSVDMYGITARGQDPRRPPLGFLGLGYSWAARSPSTFGDPVTGTPINTRLTITSLCLLYAVAYKF